MRVNQRFGKIIILGFVAVTAFSGTVYGLFGVWQNSRRPNFTNTEINAKIRIGVTKAEVKGFLGKPDDGDENSDSWMYRQKVSKQEGRSSLVIILFEDGRVSEVVLRTPKRYYPK